MGCTSFSYVLLPKTPKPQIRSYKINKSENWIMGVVKQMDQFDKKLSGFFHNMKSQTIAMMLLPSGTIHNG